MTTTQRGLQGIALLSVACALTLSMGACPSVDPTIDPIINPNPDPADQVADPAFEPAGGTFQDTLDVTVSCATPGATIRYTLDGSVPSEASGTIYTSPITLTETTTVRVVAFHDSLDPSDLVSATYTKASAAKSMTISSPTVACALVQGQAGTVSVSCMVTATLCQVQSVTVDLSRLGGAAAQPLARFGSYWSWFGTVTPPAAGTRTITFTATDTTSAATTAAVTTVVSPAPVTNAAPAISAAAAVGQLVRNQAGTVTVSCIATDSDGTIQSVQADLSTIGGPSTQSLTLEAGQWTWSGALTPSSTGTRTITFTVFDNQGASGTASTTIVVAAPNGAPSVTSPTVAGTLVLNQSCTVTVSCTATDSDGTVQSVIADLAAIGGSSTRALSQSGNTWQWSGSVTPTVGGQQTVTFAATDDDGVTTTVSTTIVVTVPNQSPSASDPQAAGPLVEGEAGSATVSCLASDPDGDLSSVRANLSAIGGSAAEVLLLSDGRWTWTGELTPPTAGSRTITFTATDSYGATASTTTTIQVAAPNAPPSVTNASATGTLTLSQSSSVTVTCDAADTDGTVPSVTADLAGIGGSSTQVLALVAGHWTWTGNVTPTSSGLKTITSTATDNEGAAGSASATITVLGSQPGSLAGAWDGNVTYSQCLILGGSPTTPSTFPWPSSMTFSAGFQPQSLAVYFGHSGVVVPLPAASLLNPGDQSTAVKTASGYTITITGTVVQVSRSATAFSIDLDLLITYSNRTTYWAGPYHWEGALLPGDQLSWSETTLLALSGGLGIDLSVTSTGTLTRQ